MRRLRLAFSFPTLLHRRPIASRPLLNSNRPPVRASSMPAAPPIPTMADAKLFLQKRFGHKAFRPGQSEVIDLLIRHSDDPPPGVPSSHVGRALAIFPTAAGKSLCYQLPAALYPRGLTLVVSPLLALMKDQTDALHRADFPAACLHSGLSASETREVFDEVRANRLRILFVSPERFNNTRFIQLIKEVQIALFAVDEAHCISEWGHTFRPDYLRLSRWADRLNCQRRLALTATATPRVAEDICAALHIPRAAAVRTPSVRSNLTTRITSVPYTGAFGTRQKFLAPRIDLLVTRLKEREPGATIIYVTLQATATMVAEELRKRGFPQAACYHAGMKTDDRKQTQDEFMSNTSNGIVVATIAFGMGMDHSSIRYVYHLNIPKSLEGYIQEIGRAGRDGLPSICETFASIDDLPVLEAFILGETPSESSVKNLIHQLFDGAKLGGHIEYSTYNLAFDHDIRDNCLGQILAQLDISENAIEESTPYYSTISLRMHPAAQREWPKKNTQAAEIIALSDVRKALIDVDVPKVAEKLGIEYGRVSRLCDDMVISGHMVDARSKKLIHRAKVTKLPDDLDQVATRLYERLIKSQTKSINRLHQVLKYFSAKECQTAHLANHLGDKYDGTECGHCEFCLNGGMQPVNIWAEACARTDRDLDKQKWALIQLEDLPTDNPLLVARFAAGVSTPVISRRYRRFKTFGSMSDHGFKVLLEAAEKDCAKQTSS